MRRRHVSYVRRLLPAAVALSLLAGCDDERAPAAAPPPAREVEVVQLTAADLPAVFEYVGRTASSQRIEIRARVAGYLDEIAYIEGGPVKTDEVLFRIDAKPFEAHLRAAQAAAAQQQSRVDNAEALLARVKPLAEANAVAQKELDDALSRVNESRAALEGAQANVYQAELDLGYTTIRSPIDGVSGAARQREGAYIGIGAAPLTYVARIDPIWVEFSVSEADVLAGRRAERAATLRLPEDGRYEVAIAQADGLEHPHRGRISFADATIDERTGTFLVRAEVPNPDHALRPGQYVQVALHGATRPNRIAVPQKAVQQSQRGPFVWVVNAQSQAEQRPVTLGPWHGDQWIIQEGLSADDRVITGPLVGLRPGMPVNIVSIARGGSPTTTKPGTSE